ncbi:MAG: hypothetical protein J0L72_10555 [Armatimonadetes bacterium]|nr:hypothetical protein [Armatimonadota bacterium]
MTKKETFQRILSLWDSYEEEDGRYILSELLKAESHQDFGFIAAIAIPKWVVLLHTMIKEATQPLLPRQVAWLCIALRGLRLPIFEASVLQLLRSQTPLSIAAAAYCLEKNIAFDEAFPIVVQFDPSAQPTPALTHPKAIDLRRDLLERYGP